MKKALFIILFLGVVAGAFSNENPDVAAKKGTVKGIILDTKTKQPLEYATIAIKTQSDNKTIDGTISDVNGFFRVTGLDDGSFYAEITFIGYHTKKVNNITITANQRTFDIGDIFLESASEELEEAVVVADRPTMTYKIDRKVINVSQQHTSASETAVEILENIPSITVDVEGNVSLRGSTSFTVLIDNKPTVLDASDALSQIPASSIENIEVITNPSAKYDPEGTAGIINIITKKNKLEGITGILNINGGTQDRYGGDFLFSMRKERFNFYLGADYNQRGRVGNRYTESWTMDTTGTRFYNISDGEFDRGRDGISGRGGFDFNINPKNTLSFSTRVGNWDMGGDSETDFQTYTDPATTTNNYTSSQISSRGGLYYSLNLNYLHDFDKKGHQLTALLSYSGRDFDETSTNTLVSSANVITSGQRSAESGPRYYTKLQLDYTLPLRIKDKFEAGYHLLMEDSESESQMEQYNTLTTLYEIDPLYSHSVLYEKEIHSIYSIYSGELEKFGYQAGLRTEYTDRDIELTESGEKASIYRWDLFPTLHLSYTLPKDQQLMGSYTRRIKRPRGHYLEPFLTWSDAYNVRQGNPELTPQYIDSYEISYLNKFGRNSLSMDLYYRVTHDKIERIRSPFEDQANVFLHTYENVGQDFALGVELMLGLDIIKKWWHVDLMGNLYDYKVEGELLGQDFSESSFNWNARFNNMFSIGKTTKIQLNAMYNSASVSAQGERSAFLMGNLAVRQSFLKNKLSATLSARDLFQSMKHSSTTTGDDFYMFSEFEPQWPMITLTLSYKINNYRPDRKKRNGGGMELDEGDEF